MKGEINRREFFARSAAGVAVFSGNFQAGAPHSAGAAKRKHLVYAQLLDPREHPDYARRHVQPPNWDTFGRQTHFITLRDFEIKDGQIVNYKPRIERYTKTYELGDVLWPFCSTIYARNLADLADEIRSRNLFLFDIWGYAPGTAPVSIWGEFKVPAGVLDLLEEKLSGHWLGMDNGEQDGRYIGKYASQLYPSSLDRREQYLNFQRHFEHLTGELGNKMSALVSLNFGHYFLKEGVYTSIGAETAQALPNGQVFYAFIRGAGKQYGVPWFGNASVFNRWGYKTYSGEGADHGPRRGASLSLMKRLMYSHILYNCIMVGFESGWFYSEQISSQGGWEESGANSGLTPIGRIQQSAARWVREVGQPGTMLTPIAVMLDYFSGWTFPRQYYTKNIYRVWGNLPYGPGDYLTDGVLNMLYPGYADSSYFHDESGFISPTPYGDAADCILSDAEGWLLARYPLLVVAGELEGGAEIRDKFEAYARQGGHLVISAGNLAKLPAGLAGLAVSQTVKHFGAKEKIQVNGTMLVEDVPFDLYQLTYPKAAHVLAETSGFPVAVKMEWGEGHITVLASPFGVGARETDGIDAALSQAYQNEVDRPLPTPFPLLRHVRAILDQAFREQMLFDVGGDLGLITCRKGPGEYTLGITNNSWREQPLNIKSCNGRIESIRAVPLDQSEKAAVGYVPESLEKAQLGVSGAKSIAGGDFCVFAVRVQEESVFEAHPPAPPLRPVGRLLTLRGTRTIKEQVLTRPTFFEHFGGVVVDWRYFQQREEQEMAQEAGWIERQKLRVIVDLTSGINLYPDLRLVDNIPEDCSASIAVIEGVMRKMERLQASDLILALHRFPDHFDKEKAWKSFEATLRRLAGEALERKLTLYLRTGPGRPPANVEEALGFLNRVGSPNLSLAPSTAWVLALKVDPQEAEVQLRNKVGLWLASSFKTDAAGVPWTTNAPIGECTDLQGLAKILRIAPQAPIVLDAVFRNQDEEYADVCTLMRIRA